MTRTAKAVVGLWAAGLLAGLWAFERPAHAQDKPAAEALFDEGKRLFVEKKYAEACPRFEASGRLDPGIGTLLFLADCYENLGRIAGAWATFREAASAARATGQADRERVATERARLLEPRLYRLTIKVEGRTPGLKVMRNDVEVKPETWDAALPVDPGAYTLTATAPGKKPWSMRLEIPPNAGGQGVTVPPLDDDPSARKPEGPRVEEKAPPPPVVETPGQGQRIAGVVVGSLGLAGLAVGGVLGGLAASKFSDAKGFCPAAPCSNKDGIALAHDAGTFADAGTAMFVFGGAALAAGVVTFAAAPGRAPSTARNARERSATRVGAVWVAPLFGPGSASLSAGTVLQ